MKRLATILCLFTMCVAGCGAKETINEVDVKQATGLVLALALAGFDGDFNLEIRAVVEAYGKTSFGTESAGTQFGARGHINPAAVSPAKIQAILNAIEALGVGQPEVADVPESPDSPSDISRATDEEAETDGAFQVARSPLRVRYATEIIDGRVVIRGLDRRGREVSREVLIE